MARDRKNKDIEELLGVIRKQHKELSHLKKELSRYSKQVRKDKDLINNFTSAEEEDIDTVAIDSEDQCPKCDKSLIIIALGKMGKLVRCSDCTYNKLIKLTK